MEWDHSTVTPGDYSVEMEISQSQYEHFLSAFFSGDSEGPFLEVSKGQAFSNFLIRELPKMILQELGPEVSPQLVEIAVVKFAYHNEELIRILKRRGNCIR